MKKTIYCVAAFLIFMVTGCSGDGPENRNINIDLTRSESEAVRAVNDFTFDLMRASEKRFGEENPNYIMSPQSVAWSIAMVANGASPDSETLREMLGVLKLEGDAGLQDVNDYCAKLISAIAGRSAGGEIGIANAVHYDREINIRKDYVNKLKSFYDVSSFENPSNEEIDRWISGRTGGMITDFASKNEIVKRPFGVINTLYFSGIWTKPFNKDYTCPKDFHNIDGTVSQPLTMTGAVYGRRADNETCRLLQLDFKGGSFRINFIIPQENRSISEVLASLTGETWRNLIGKMEGVPEVYVQIPKLDLTSDFDLRDVIEDMGLRKAFTRDTELTEIAEYPVIMEYLDQTSAIRLDETGVKVSASTDFSGYLISAAPGIFHLDEPFYYFITEESTGAILFAGKISQL